MLQANGGRKDWENRRGSREMGGREGIKKNVIGRQKEQNKEEAMDRKLNQ